MPEEQLSRIFNLFFDLIVRVGNKKQADQILSELITPTEKVMMAKRIACYYLIYKKIPNAQIGETLKLSISTIIHYRYVFENAIQIKQFLSKRLTDGVIKNILKDFFVEIIYGMPRKGSDWSRDKKIYYRHKRERQQQI